MKDKRIGCGIFTLIVPLFVVAMIILMSCTAKVPAGYVGVVYSMNGGIEESALTQGWHVVGITKHVTTYPVSLEQSYMTKGKTGDSSENEQFTASSSESKKVYIELSYSYRFKSDEITKTFSTFRGKGSDQIRDDFIKPNIQNWIKEVIPRFTVTEILGVKREQVNTESTEWLASKFAPYGIEISNVTIDASVDEETEEAISKKIQAQQDAETAKIKNQQKIDKAKADAKAKEEEARGKAEADKINAEADAEVMRIKAEAEANATKLKAEANRELAKSINNDLINYNLSLIWNGKLPSTLAGSESPLSIIMK